jgi:PAS domain S-box-containing protein
LDAKDAKDVVDAKPADGIDASFLSGHERLRSVLEASLDAIIQINEEGRIVAFNQSAEAMFGYAASEVLGENVSLLMPSPDRERHDEYIARYLRTGERRIIGVNREVTGLRKDGTRIPIYISIAESEGPPRLFTGVLRNLSEIREAREEVEKGVRFLGTVLDSLSGAVAVLDAEGRVLALNRTWRGNADRDRALAPRGVDVGADYLDACRRRVRGEDASLQDAVERVAAVLHGAQGRFTFEYPCQAENRWFLLDATRLQGPDGGGVIFQFDVTDRKRLERDLIETERRLLQSERLSAIGEAMTGLAHEARNALARSEAALRMLERRTEDRPEAAEYILRARRAQMDVQRLFEEVRQYAAPVKLHLQPLDVGALVQGAWEELSVVREGRDARLEETGTDVDRTCFVDEFSVQRVFRNLLENSLQSCTDPVVLSVRYEDAQVDGRAALRVVVGDNGPGIPEADVEKIFQAFFTTRTRGTGLGLAIVKRIVESHGGRIRLDRAAAGAQFVIEIPRGAP